MTGDKSKEYLKVEMVETVAAEQAWRYFTSSSNNK